MEHQVPLLEQVLMEAVQSERQQRLSQWQESVESSLCKQSAWIKRKSNIALALGSTSSTSSSTAQQVRHIAIHPVQQIKQAEEIWLRHWSADPAANTEDDLDSLQRFIADAHPCAPAYQVDVPWNASVLQQVARKMAGKAAGPDHWQTDKLLLLPDTWWDAFARLWAVVYGTSSAPTRWKDARISLLPKPSGDLRPLSLVSVCWRIGAKQQVFEDVGAISDDADGEVAFVTQDLSRFFDSINVNHLFVGCPLSPLLSAVVMTVWGRHVAGAGVHTLSFVDDRTFWSDSFAQLEAAKRLSEEFDDLFQFSCAPSKSTIAFASGWTTGVLAQSLFQYTGASTLTLLGLSYHLDDRCPPELAKLNLTKVQIRMRYIKVVPGYFFHKVTHIRRLVLPMLCWAAGFSVISAEVVHGQWYNVLPAAQAILQELGWWHSADGCFLLRADHSGSCRRVELGVDNPSVLQEWLADWHRVRAVRNCTRIRKRLHRDDASLVVGMDLPGPPDPPLCVFAGHVATWKATGSIHSKRAALASGCSFWWKHPRCKEFSDNDPRLLCAVANRSPPGRTWSGPVLSSQACNIGMFGDAWHSVDRGILQGCPFSPTMLAAAVMSLWTSHVACPGLACLACIDDRCFWSQDAGIMLLAKARSDEFDDLLGFCCSLADFQECSEHEMFGTFYFKTRFAPQRRAIFAFSPAASANLLFDPPEPQKWEKTQCSRLS
eukprot:s2089_g4.t2